MHDIKERFRYNTGSIDMIHARSITLAVRTSQTQSPSSR